MPAIIVNNLGKRFEVPIGPRADYATLRESLQALVGRLAFWRKRTPTTRPFWALQDVSFEVQPGEVVGLIGRNGAGKSTLLKILSRITPPSVGEVRLRGRVGSLLEVGTGFHPELTGRENVYLNGSILGMPHAEIRRKFDEIVAFADVGAFLDTPIKRYSSGMYARLAFAVAAHLEPEILVIDEVLAVGDAEFQRKCLAKMGEVATAGRTVLFVSHNMGAIQTVCQRAVLLESGRIKVVGPVREVVTEYQRGVATTLATPLGERRDRTGQGRFRFVDLYLLDGEGTPTPFGITGQELQIGLRLETPPGSFPAPLEVSVGIFDGQGNKLTEVGTHLTGHSPRSADEARHLRCRVPRLPLLAGEYRIDLWCGLATETEDHLQEATVLRIEPGNYFGNTQDARLPTAEKQGCIMIPQEWASAEGPA
jgi:lipopolysaccharide transport system ATP-binding protein